MRVIDIVGGTLLAASLMLLFAGWVSDFDGADIAGACRDNGGVRQVHASTWTPPVDSKAVIVCKDGDIAVIR